MTYSYCKTVIANQLADGSLNADKMRDMLDIFLLNGRITGDEYVELMQMMEVENDE